MAAVGRWKMNRDAMGGWEVEDDMLDEMEEACSVYHVKV